jgi:hypothetical protein
VFTTILRDPVKRVISEFFWGLQEGWCADGIWPSSMCASLEALGILSAGADNTTTAMIDAALVAWIQAPVNPALNRQTKFLAAFGEHQPRKAHWQSCDANDKFCCLSYGGLEREYIGSYGGMTSNMTLERAINGQDELADTAIALLNSRFYFVGLQEQLSRSVNLFVELLVQRPGAIRLEAEQQLKEASLAATKLAFGHGRDAHSSRLPPSLEGYSPALHILDAIKSANRLDERVYAHVVGVFEEACQRADAKRAQ